MTARAGEPVAPLAAPDVIRARLASAGITLPRSEAVVLDLATDRPLEQSAAQTAVDEAARLVEALGAALLATRARRGVIAVRADQIECARAVEEAVRAAGAEAVEVARVEPVWPSVGVERDVAGSYALRLDLDAARSIEAAAFARAPIARRITIAGNVARPGVLAVTPGESIESLIARAGGVVDVALGVAWAALDGGAWGGRVADPEAAPVTGLVLVLPLDHALVLRARASTSDWLRRAASACEGCRACTDACPVALDGTPLAPHAIAQRLAASSDHPPTFLAAAACVGCGVCDAVCPAALMPSRLVAAVHDRLDPVEIPPRGDAHPDRAGRRTSIALLLARAGLG